MTGSNRFEYVGRERVHGIIEGVDFGYNLSVIARSPAVVLCWSGGSCYTSARETRYGKSSFVALWRKDHHGIPKSETWGDGGRLSIVKVQSVRACLEVFFGEDLYEQIVQGVCRRQTLLIEGGGAPLMPSRHLGPDAYKAWKKISPRGLYGEE